MLPIEWRPSALEDLVEIMQYISARNAIAAQRLFERIEASIEHTSEHPYLYKLELTLFHGHLIVKSRRSPRCRNITYPSRRTHRNFASR